MNLQIIKKRKFWYIISSTLILISIISLILFGLKPSIDFTGGTLMELKLSDKVYQTVDISTGNTFANFLNANIANNSTGTITVQKTQDNYFILRFKEISQEDRTKLIEALKEKVDPDIVETKFESIGPTLGKELQKNTTTAIIISVIAIIIYIAFAFKQVSYPIKSWKYGTIGIIALIHDILITIGVFSLLGKFLNVEVDSLFITALLTILGYSINDTIVIYDRIRENLRRTNGNFEDIVNNSLNETMARSINTTITTLLSLIAVFLFGGDSIKMFALALIVGITLGSYSSIFVASPLLVDLYNFENRKKISQKK